jgi:hypothetical protein
VDPDLKVRAGSDWVPYYRLYRPEAWGPDFPKDQFARSGKFGAAEVKALQTRDLEVGMQQLAAFRREVLGLDPEPDTA